MSNDLLFSIIPREGRVTVRSKDKVRKVSKEKQATGVGEDEHQEHEVEKRVDGQEQFRRMQHHTRSTGQDSEHPKQKKSNADEGDDPAHVDLFV